MMLTKKFIRSPGLLLRRLVRREEGSVSIEAAIVLPAIFLAFLSIFAIFDAYRMYSINQKAAFTIGDAVSRETLPIDNNYLNGVQNLFEYLTRADDSAIRITSVWYDADNDRFYRDWSQSRGWVENLTSSDVRNWHDKLPLMVDNERIMVVETWTRFKPPFKTGLENQMIRNFVFTRPRYAPRVCWNDCN
ncbi:MAG: pilus assembly protein [Sulfitobacter sp.]|nr:pilus assembly protein [Sulfitobacter sp.]